MADESEKVEELATGEAEEGVEVEEGVELDASDEGAEVTGDEQVEAEQDAKVAEDEQGAEGSATEEESEQESKDQPEETKPEQEADDVETPDDEQTAEQDAPEPVSAQKRIIGTAQRAAQAGTATVTEGVSAMRELSAARRAHATAFKELESLERDATQLEQQLEHRREVEDNYEQIVKLQTQETEDAARALEQARVRRVSLESQLEGKKNELTRLKDANEQKVAPSRKLMEQAKGALTKAERAQAEALRALKGAQAQANEAQANRDSKLQAAKRSADSASAKLARQQDQLAEMRRDPSTGAKALSQASSAVAAALAQLENARENVTRVTQETSQVVQIAQTHLYTQRKSLEEAEADLREAREREEELRGAYDAKRSKADEQEADVSSKISALKDAVEQARDEEAGARGRGDAARAALEEANDIHAHPELTDELARRSEASRAQADEQRKLVERLASEEHMVRERTEHTRKIFYALVAAAVVIVLLVLVFALG